MNKKAIIILGVVFVLTVAFIWGNSMLSPELSDKISRFAGDVLSKFAGVGDEVSTVGGLSVRKMGHFCEFFALGIVAWLLLEFSGLHIAAKVLVAALTGISVPLLDETIQMFSGRGPMIKDVWIDIGGFVTGALATFLMLFAVCAIVKRSKNKHKI